MKEDLHDLKNLIPLFVLPKKDELFSSWFYRLSRANYLTTVEFSKHFLGIKFYINRDYDYHLDELIIDRLSYILPISKDDISQLSLKTFNGKLFKKITHNKPNKWILSTGQFSQGNIKPNYQYCPYCKKQFFEKWNRLILFTNCLDCGTRLINRCLNCNEVINYLKQDIGRKYCQFFENITTCFKCNQEITSNKVPTSSNSNIGVVNLWRNKMLQNSSPQTIQYFEILYQLASKIRFLDSDFIIILNKCYNEDISSVSLSGDLNELDVDSRMKLFKIANQIILISPILDD